MESPNTVETCGIFTPTKIRSNPPCLAYQYRELPLREAQNRIAEVLADQYRSFFLLGKLENRPDVSRCV